MKSMTYGKMPTRAEFTRAYGHALGSYDRMYGIKWSPSDSVRARGTTLARGGEFTEPQLYLGVRQLTMRWARGDEGAGDLASSILSTLGFEWV